MKTLSFETSSDQPKQQKQSFRAGDAGSEAPHLNAAENPPLNPKIVSQTSVNSSAISPPQGIRSKWSNTEQKPAAEQVAHPKNRSSRNRLMFLIALVTITPILAVMSAVLSDARFSDVLQNPRKQALLIRVIARASQGFPPAAQMLYEQAHNLDPAEPNYYRPYENE
jgi:hypothetical protein